jgi:structural maintenance of chromosome 2
LLKNNSFGYRVDLIPNNKIVSSKDINKDLLDYIKRVTRGKAYYALDLIRYHMHVENSIKYVFGDVLVCEDIETAKKMAYDP